MNLVMEEVYLSFFNHFTGGWRVWVLEHRGGRSDGKLKTYGKRNATKVSHFTCERRRTFDSPRKKERERRRLERQTAGRRRNCHQSLLDLPLIFLQLLLHGN